jgi:hypothetical protein
VDNSIAPINRLAIVSWNLDGTRPAIRPAPLHQRHPVKATREPSMTTVPRPAIQTLANLESAFAGESMAHLK